MTNVTGRRKISNGGTRPPRERRQPGKSGTRSLTVQTDGNIVLLEPEDTCQLFQRQSFDVT
jgi:hypothetical protein